MRAPEACFYESVKELCRLARKRAKDPREAIAASELEIEMDKRIKRVEDGQPELELERTGTGGGK